MVISSIAFAFPEIDERDVTAEHIRYATWMRLPFRLRTGVLRRFVMSSPEEAEIWVYNRTDVPPGTELMDVMRKLHASGQHTYDPLWSEILAIIKRPQLPDGLVASIRAGGTKIDLTKNIFRAGLAVQKFICAYSTATVQLTGGAPLRTFTDMDLFNHTYGDMAIFCSPDHALSPENVREIFGWRPEREVVQTGGQLHGTLTDLPDAELAKIEPMLPKLADHPFYEIAFKAKTEMVARDPLVAIVLACAALEGVHAAYLRKTLGPSLESRKGLMTDLLREQGIFTLIKVTALHFLPENVRPSKEMLDRCLDGITIRNDIMHIKSTDAGYKMAKHTFNEMSEGYRGLIEMYALLAAQLE